MGLVYSTGGGRVRRCPHCGGPLQDGRCGCRAAARPTGDGILRVRRETGGRRGKTVTTISGFAGTDAELRALAGQLKKLCATGGSVAEGRSRSRATIASASSSISARQVTRSNSRGVRSRPRSLYDLGMSSHQTGGVTDKLGKIAMRTIAGTIVLMSPSCSSRRASTGSRSTPTDSPAGLLAIVAFAVGQVE